MEIIQKPISPEHNSAMFFDGVLATHRGLELRTFNDGEISYEGQHMIGKQIVEMGKANLINDNDIEEERTSPVSILVDKFIAIVNPRNSVPEDEVWELWDEELIFDNYSDAVEAFMQV